MKNKNIYIAICFLFGFANSYGQTLADYLNEAEKNSSQLQALQYSYESALEKVNEVGSLPNTTFGAGVFVQDAETRVGAQKAKLSAKQMLPWFGTLTAKKESAIFKANAQLNVIDYAKRKLFLEVKKSYFKLYELKSKAKLLQAHIKILNTYETLALNELENNRSTMVEVLKIKIERNELTNSLNTVSENLKVKKISFNLLLNKNEKTIVNILDTLIIKHEERLFNKNLISKNPKLLQLENLESALVKSELAAKKEALPAIGVGLDYIFVEDRPVANLSDNGKDIIMPMVTVSIPLFSKKFSSKQKQLQLEQKAIASKKIETTNQLYELYENAFSNLTTAKFTIKTQLENIVQVNQVQKVLLTAYQTGRLDFDQLLEVQRLKLKYQLNKVIAEKEYAIQKANLEFLTE